MAYEAPIFVSVVQVPGIAVEMPSEIWSRLPTGLIAKVLMRLGIGDEARLAVVCKAWRQLFLSSWFRVERCALGSGGPNQIWILYLSRLDFGEVRSSLLSAPTEKNRVQRVTLDLDFLPIGHGNMLSWNDVACMCRLILTYSKRGGSCCIWNLANKTWRMLPPEPGDHWGLMIWFPWVRVVESGEHGASTIQLWSTFWDLAIKKPFVAVCSSNCWVWNKVVTLERPRDAVDASPNFTPSVVVVCKGVVYVIPNMCRTNGLEYYDMVTGKFLGRQSLLNGTLATLAGTSCPYLGT